MDITYILQILLSGFVVGIILFQTAIAAPIVFSSLKPDQSRIFIRRVFPIIFTLLFSIGIIMIILILFYGAKHPSQLPIGLITFIFPLICAILVPATNRATDQNNNKKFNILHRISVILTMVVLILNLIWPFYSL